MRERETDDRDSGGDRFSETSQNSEPRSRVHQRPSVSLTSRADLSDLTAKREIVINRREPAPG